MEEADFRAQLAAWADRAPSAPPALQPALQPADWPDAPPAAAADAAAAAAAARERGNRAFQAGRLDEAAACYSDAVSLDPSSHLALANRAAVGLKLGRPADALRDCDAALAIDAQFAKAHARRARALLLLGHAEEALRAIDRALAREPKNPDFAREREAVLRDGPSLAAAAAVAAEDRPSLAAEPPALEAEPRALAAVPEGRRIVAASPAGCAVSEAELAAMREYARSRDRPLPRSFYELEKAHGEFGGDPGALYRYFVRVPPETYPALFGASLSRELLAALLAAFYHGGTAGVSDCEDTVVRLTALRAVPRYGMLKMLLSQQARAASRDLRATLLLRVPHLADKIEALDLEK